MVLHHLSGQFHRLLKILGSLGLQKKTLDQWPVAFSSPKVQVLKWTGLSSLNISLNFQISAGPIGMFLSLCTQVSSSDTSSLCHVPAVSEVFDLSTTEKCLHLWQRRHPSLLYCNILFSSFQKSAGVAPSMSSMHGKWPWLISNYGERGTLWETKVEGNCKSHCSWLADLNY